MHFLDFGLLIPCKTFFDLERTMSSIEARSQFLTSISWWIMDNGQRGSRPFDCKSYQSHYAECVWWLRIQFCRYNGKALPTTRITNGWLKNQSYNFKVWNILRAHRISSNLLSVHILYMNFPTFLQLKRLYHWRFWLLGLLIVSYVRVKTASWAVKHSSYR